MALWERDFGPKAPQRQTSGPRRAPHGNTYKLLFLFQEEV